MDTNYTFPSSPGRPTPLLPVSPDRVNRQSENASPSSHSRDSSVHEKISKFDSLAYQGKALERRTADAALKRAMMGREEAETEMRRYREEARALKKQTEEGRDRERKVGERLEDVMEKYGRAKETHAHTQALWEKEIRRARKESFKSQSAVVKLQEELKSARSSLRIVQGDLANEKERSSKREQEAFAARYQIVGVQEDLANVMEKLKLMEQERDALKTLVKNEEIARIAAEGQIPLPRSMDDEFASPRRVTPLARVNVLSSAASEEEIEHLREELSWERRKAQNAWDQIEFMHMECQFKCCSCHLAESKGQDFIYVSAPKASRSTGSQHSHHTESSIQDERRSSVKPQLIDFDLAPKQQSAIFIPAEGVFRTIEPAPEESPWISPAKPFSRPQSVILSAAPIPVFNVPEPRQSLYARTPSCEPPSTAIVPDTRASLASLLSYDSAAHQSALDEAADADSPVTEETEQEDEATPRQVFHTISTTTRIPLALPSDVTPTNQPSLAATGLPLSLDPALSPTMTREEALAMIRERRGRARSLAQGTLTPRKQMVEGGARRDISAPAVRSGAVRGRLAGRP